MPLATLTATIVDSGGSAVGSAKTGDWPVSLGSPLVLGASNNLWGGTPTPAHLNTGGLTIKGVSVTPGITLMVDSVLVEVFYTPAEGKPTLASKNPLSAVRGMRGFKDTAWSMAQRL